jgi:hypothetical protein
VDLGRFDLNLTRDTAGQWRIASFKDGLIPIGPGLPDAPDVDATLAPFVHPFLAAVGRIGPIGTDPAARLRQTNQLIADALRQQTGADLAIQPINASDGGIWQVFRHSTVTRYDIYSILPYHDDVTIATLTGRQIEALLAGHPGSVVSPDNPHPASDRSYNVAVVDFVAESFYKIPPAELRSTGHDCRDAVIAYIRQLGRNGQAPRLYLPSPAQPAIAGRTDSYRARFSSRRGTDASVFTISCPQQQRGGLNSIAMVFGPVCTTKEHPHSRATNWSPGCIIYSSFISSLLALSATRKAHIRNVPLGRQTKTPRPPFYRKPARYRLGVRPTAARNTRLK